MIERSSHWLKKLVGRQRQVISDLSVSSSKVLDYRKRATYKAQSPLQITGESPGWLGRLGNGEKQPAKNTANPADEKEEQLALANALSRIVISSSTLSELCEGFASELKTMVPIDWAVIGMIDKSSDVLHVSPLSTRINSAWELGDTIPMAYTPVEWMVKNEKAMLEPDLSRKSRFRTGKHLLKQKIKAAVYMPLFSRREIFGGIIIGSYHTAAYNERELKLLKYTTTQLSMAIENNRLFGESRDGIKREADFIATLTHELKTPLTPIRASGELLAEEFHKDPGNVHAKLADNILRSAHNLDSKISEMLELAKVQSPGFKLKRKALEIKPLINEVVDQLKPVAKDKVQGLNLKIPPALPKIKADDYQLKRVIYSLLLNAILLTPMGGSVDLAVKKQKSELVIDIKDAGKGFSPKEQKHLFEVYHASEGDRQGRPLELRLRLAICKRLVDLHKGRIWVESREGKGSTFSFTVPLS
ncbi:ATP-binding protein [Chloroflexota bacterium]